MTDHLKHEFIQYMEEIHSSLLYPKNFFGCMMAVFVEQQPITQDRIEILTGYSKTTISQMLALIQVNFPLKQIKKLGDRKKYYIIEIPVKDFMLTFLNMIVHGYEDKVDFLLPLLDELAELKAEHPRFANFEHFLRKMHESGKFYLQLIHTTTEDFKSIITTGKIDASEVLSMSLVDSPDNLRFIQKLMEVPKIPDTFPEYPPMEKDLEEKYIAFKQRFYHEFRENLTSGESQIITARSVIGTEVLLEQHPLTQEEIEIATGIPRSIVSEIVNRLVEWGMMQELKKPGDRKKYYVMVQSWENRMIRRFKVNTSYATRIQGYLRNLKQRAQQGYASEEPETKEHSDFIFFLEQMLQVYVQFEQYYKLLEMKYLNMRLQEYLLEKQTRNSNGSR